MSESDSLSVVQLNMNGCYIVSEQLLDYSMRNSVDVLLLQEPPSARAGVGGMEAFSDRSVFCSEEGEAQAAIVVLNRDIEVVALRHLMNRFFAVANLTKSAGKSITLVSAYFKYSIPTQVFTAKLGHLLERLGNRVIVGADVNAHSPQWFSRPGNHTGSARGKWVEGMIEDGLLTVHNRSGCLETYSKPGMGSSNIDVTLSRGGELVEAVHGWDVVDEVTDSDHRLITYQVSCGRVEAQSSSDRRRFNVKKADWDKFRRVLTQEVIRRSEELEEEIEVASKALVTSLQVAMEASMPKSCGKARSNPPWWHNGLTESKRRVSVFRRTKDYKGEDRDEYRRVRNAHLSEVRKAKWNSWKGFASSVNEDVWGRLYKWARKGSARSRVPCSVKRSDGTFTETARETAKCLLETLIPCDRIAPILDGHKIGRTGFVLTEKKVKEAIWRMAPNKAPGLDGITAGVLRKAWVVVGPLFTKLLDRCLRASVFPDCWKTADVVTILKGPDKDLSNPKSYRPVSLLSVPSKVLERLIVTRLEDETREVMSHDQHGFTIGKSTISAIQECFRWVDNRSEKLVVGVFLDISGAFDNLDWQALIRDISELGASESTRSIIESYLVKRRAVLTVGKSTASTLLTRGCPQGSQLGPVLWKMSMNEALRIERTDKVKVIAYADDLAVLAAGHRFETVRNRICGFLEKLRGWAAERGLTFSASKSQAMSLKGGPKPGFTIPFGDDTITAVSPVRYLGVEVDDKRKFLQHLSKVAGKSDDLYSRLRAATSANWGMRHAASGVIYRAVFLPRICYASEIWHEAVRFKKAVKLLGSKQRRALLSMTGAYRTTSTDSLQVVAGQLPLDLEVQWSAVVKDFKSGRLTEAEKGERRESILDEWQTRWSGSEKGRWTFGLLPDVRERLSIPMVLDHYTVQFLTGHGDFNDKLHSLRLVRSARCRCRAEAETVEHVLFRCERHEEIRERLRETLGDDGGAWPCAPSEFLKSRKRFEALAKFARAAIVAKQDEERTIRG